jgi:putative phosphoribosyl transferase
MPRISDLPSVKKRSQNSFQRAVMQQNLESDLSIYKNRQEAAKDLLAILPEDELKRDDWIILALSRGGAIISEYLAKSLGINYDIFIVKPILATNNDECQIAMVSETKEIVINEPLVKSFGISEDYIFGEAKRVFDDNILKDIYSFRDSLPLSDIGGKMVLLVDEGCESGLSTMCAIKSTLNLNTKKVSIAVPVIADDLYHVLDLKVDNIYTNHKIENFIEVKEYYRELERPSRKEIKSILQNSKNYLPFKKES